MRQVAPWFSVRLQSTQLVILGERGPVLLVLRAPLYKRLRFTKISDTEVSRGPHIGATEDGEPLKRTPIRVNQVMVQFVQSNWKNRQAFVSLEKQPFLPR